MAARLAEYDWFLYTEDDCIIPLATVTQHMRLAENLYQSGHVIGAARMVTNDTGSIFYQDISLPASRSKIFTVASTQLIRPTQTYAACWLYPRTIMRDFASSAEWNPPEVVDKFVRVKMAAGFRRSSRVLVVGDDGKLMNSFVFHLGYSGKYFSGQFRRLRSESNILAADDFFGELGRVFIIPQGKQCDAVMKRQLYEYNPVLEESNFYHWLAHSQPERKVQWLESASDIDASSVISQLEAAMGANDPDVQVPFLGNR
jgi:hypothetical protein